MANPRLPADMYLVVQTSGCKLPQCMFSEAEVIRQHERVLSGLGAVTSRGLSTAPDLSNPSNSTIPHLPRNPLYRKIYFPPSPSGELGEDMWGCHVVVLAVAIKVSLAVSRPNMNPWKSRVRDNVPKVAL